MYAYILLISFMIFIINTGADIFADNLELNQPVLQTFGNDTWTNVGITTNYILAETGFFYEILTLDPNISYFTTFILIPSTLIFIFIFITEILIPFIIAIGGLIPFT